MTIRFIGLETSDVRRIQAGGVDANGQAPERQVSDGKGTPCRHCLAGVAEGEPYLILAYRPFPVPQPYAEQGPIFLHAGACPSLTPSAEVPAMLASPQYIIRGYDARDRIVYGSGQIVPTCEIPDAAERLLESERIAYVHVRSASSNCYQCRIERA